MVDTMSQEVEFTRSLPDGVLLVDKPPHMTSFGVVARVRRLLSKSAGKKIKVGHTGTLDPFATGLLILVVGKECRNAGQYSKQDKVYEAGIRLGETSTTGDPEGEVRRVSDTIPEREHIVATLQRFTGEVSQTPPSYSAIKINGRRAYKLARSGQAVEMPTRQVTIHSLELLHYDYPMLYLRAHVSSGTYIRTLAEDIGEALSVGAYCQELRRMSVGEREVGDALGLPDEYLQ